MTDLEFLKDLQHELNTQTNDGNADPVYWGIMERKMVRVAEDCGDPYISTQDCLYTLEEYIDYLKEEIDDNVTDYEEWSNVDLTDIDEVVEFSNEIGYECEIIYMEEQDVLSHNTGAFLTKREAKRYIDNYGYNHSKPRTWAMTAFRNFEYERLLNIIKTIDLNKLEGIL